MTPFIMTPLAKLLPNPGWITSSGNPLRTPIAENGLTVSYGRSVGGESLGSKSANSALVEIAARYDVKKITPREFAQMLQQLQQAGALSETDRQLLLQILVDLHQEGIDPNETIDLVQFYTKKVKKFQDSLQGTNTDPQTRTQLGRMLAEMEKRLDWLRRFALWHTCPDLLSLDLLS
ncbi:MAG: hypothetical protein NZ602_13370 [Thermoguttaceae bacterium]|nr:hypothetical protein [Thermoguttaceae bacterium]MDW8037159.1 hypothetical protein [Thermoguttaceae bacterium]